MARPKRSAATVRAVYLRPWRIDISARLGVQAPVSTRVLALTAARALTAADAPSPASIALILSDDRELAALNAEHMGEDGPTDVLSFPLLPPSAFPSHPGKTSEPSAGRPIEPAYQAPHRQRTHLGDIVISVERAIGQAPASPVDELRQLVVHGVLHICGWDHAHPEENELMRALEKKVLSQR